jgi:hypothetical protein
MSIRFKITDARNGGGSALMFFNLAIGYDDDAGQFHGLFKVRDMVLRRKNDGKLTYQGPQKDRVRKATAEELAAGSPKYVPVTEVSKTNGQTYPVRDNIFDLYGEMKDTADGKTYVTAGEAWDARDAIIALAEEAYKGLSNAGRGAAAPSNAPKATGATSKGSPLGDTPAPARGKLPF